MRFELAVFSNAKPVYVCSKDWNELSDAVRLATGFLGYDPDEEFALTVGGREVSGTYGAVQLVSVEVRRESGG